jgi:hypothetical protein
MENYKKSKTECINDFIYDILYSLFNTMRCIKFLFEKLIFNKHKELLKNKELKNIYKNKRCFVLGNGPSLNAQNIELLKDEIVFMVNRSFLDSRYEIIKPKYHVIVDSKLATGVWPITYLDDIAQKNPDVIFLLNSKWFDLEIFQAYKKKYTIYWIDQSLELTNFNLNKKIDLTKKSYGKYVVEQGIVTASYMGCDTIYITGVDGDGFANLLLNQPSHSYGTNNDDIERFKSWRGIREAICSVCNWMLSWHYLNKYILNNQSKIVNLSGRGIITMVETDNFDNVVRKLND